MVPWDYEIEDENYQKEPWILNKGKEYVTIEKDKNNKGWFHLQKDEEKSLSLKAQLKLTYHQLIEFGYKLRNLRLKLQVKINITNSTKVLFVI